MVASRLYLGGQRAAKNIEDGSNDAGITHVFDCRGDNLTGSHMVLSVQDLQAKGVKYARVETNRIMNLVWDGRCNVHLKFLDEAARITSGPKKALPAVKRKHCS